MSGTLLDYSKFKSVFVDIFTQDTALNGALWGVSWGSASQFSFGSNGLTLTSTAAAGWPSVGFMQAPTGKSSGEGYGLYQFTGYANAGQGTGIGFIMWRADNVALDPSQPNVATEIDVLESWDGTKTGESTIHYYNSGWSGGNGQEYNALPTSIDLTQVHTYAMDWERGSLTFYVDGVQIYQDTTHAPLDYADGGSNEVMGAELINMSTVVKTPTVQLHITEMEYSAPVASGSPSPSVPAAAGSTVLGANASYSAPSGETVQAASGDTITASSGNVSVIGNSGSLRFTGGSSKSTVSGGNGTLTAYSGTGGGNYVGGTAGHNWLVSQGASGSNTTLTGGGAGDALFGGSGNNLLEAGPGNDTVLGGSGPTTIIGGSAASSVVFTGSGVTNVFGGVAGGDIVVGGSGNLNVTAQKGDAVFGGGGTLSVSGSTSGGDSIVGGNGALSVTGRGGNMLVVTGNSTSTIQTGNGASLIFAEFGANSVFGGTGWMEIVMGAGKLTVAEAGGPTTYVVSNGSAGGTDVLNGFRVGTDQIDLYGYNASQQSMSVSAGSTFVNLSDGTKIELVGVTNLGSSIVG